jgi:Tol biopolymer transport system component
MITQKLLKSILCLIAVLLLSSNAGNAQVSNADKLYEDGVYQMEAAGNFEGAVDYFNRIVTEYPENKQVASKALIMLGICYERLGNQQAEEAYQQVIDKYSDQTAQVAHARELLAQLHEKNSIAGQTIKLEKGIVETNSLSPDGTKMAGTDFTEGQNVAFYDFLSGETKLVTHHNWHDAWTYYPLWSPDGKEIAYIKAGWASNAPYSLWISDLEGNSRLLYENSNTGSVIYPCEWLPNGEGIVAELSDGDDNSLAIISVKDGRLNVLHEFEKQNLGIASVSPDGRFVVFTDGERNKRDIEIINVETKEITTFDDNPSDDTSPRWSPDGKHIVFKSNRHGDWALWGMAVKDAKPDGAAFMIMAGARDFSLLNWSSSGLVMTRVISASDIYTMPIEPFTAKSIGEPKPIRYTPTGSNYIPSYSHDGKHISFMSVDTKKGSITLVISSPDGTEPREFTVPPNFGGSDIRWTPDNTALGFAGIDSSQKAILVRFTLKTEKWEKWPLEMNSWSKIEWGKDGNSFYYIDNGFTGNAVGIYTRNLGDTVCKSLMLAREDEVIRSLRFSPDYSRLAYDQNATIWFLDMATGISKRVTPECDTLDNGLLKVNYHHPAWSPDGKHLMVVRINNSANGGQSYEVTVFDIEKGTSEKLDLGRSLPKDAQIRSVDWSPEGDKMLLETVSWVFEDHLMKNVIPDNQL